MSIKIVQTLLKSTGYDPGDLDGLWGKDTLAALQAALADAAAFQSVGRPAPTWSLSARDLQRLEGVDPRLVGVVKRAAELSDRTFMVVEGLRTIERQRQLYAQGRNGDTRPVVTWTLKSKHIDGQAVDLAPTAGATIDWNDLAGFNAVAKAMLQAGAELGVNVRWGADWDQDGKPRERGETDSPHFEIGAG